MRSLLPRLLLLTLLLLPGCLARTTPPAPTTQPTPSLPSRLHETLHRLSSTGATISARVIDLSTNRELYAHDPDKPVIPASNMKLPVSAAALDHFGANHSFKTHLALSNNDLYLIGSGDPATGDPRLASRNNPNGNPTDLFDAWAAALQQRGITQIKGDLVYVANTFDEQLTHPSWSRSFLTDWYAAPTSGLNFNDNCIDITIHPTEEGQPVRYEVMPPAADVKIINNCTTGTGDPAPAISRAADSNTFTLTGHCSKKTKLESKPVIDPAAFFADALRTHLASKGITISGQTRPAPSIPQDHQILATHETKMPDLLWRLNKNSQNLFAEALCKSLGAAATNQPGSWQTGGAAVRAFLAKHNISDTGFTLTDGSGLARTNRVTTRLISDLLVVMHRHPHAAVFRASLPISGADGTIAGRMADLKGHVHAKTGYIGGVRSLSGYATTRSGRTLVFSFIYNNIPGSVKPYEALQDEACRILVEATDAELDRSTGRADTGLVGSASADRLLLTGPAMHPHEPPRLPLANLPTPVAELKNLAKHLGIPRLLIKRDDLTGLETSGNKIRKLEYVLADALRNRADTLVTSGGYQSNHCRATASAGARLGLRVRLLLRTPEPNPPSDGNLFLDRLFGADISLHDASDYNACKQQLIDEAMDVERRAGRKPYFFPVGASVPLGVWGYIRCFRELATQLGRTRHVDVFAAVGSSGTLAGLVLGRALFRCTNWRVLGVPICDSVEYFQEEVRELERRTVAEHKLEVNEHDTPIELLGGFIGEGYALPTNAGLDAVRLVARTEGIALDPTYTSKAFAAMLEHIRSGQVRRNAVPLFIHTGGVFGLMARRDLFAITEAPASAGAAVRRAAPPRG